MRQLLTLVLVAVGFASVTAGQQPTFRAGVDAVRVDVSVTDHGKPVHGLAAGNFVVTDNGTPEPVASRPSSGCRCASCCCSISAAAWKVPP